MKNIKKGIRIEDINLGLVIGRYYIVENMTNKKIKDNSIYFRGILIQETDYFYVFRGESKYCQCFLKVEFAINNYRIKEFMIKAS